MSTRNLLLTILVAGAAVAQEKVALYRPLLEFVQQRTAEFDRISPERKDMLRSLSKYIADARAANKPVRLTFICTHNSRRSHMAQIWARIAAEQYGISAVQTYSGGTESTAFNPRAVATLTRAGVRIERTTDDENPVYHVRYGDAAPPITCFSKVYDQAPNPKKDFCAVMTCDDADAACPVVRGAAARVALPYVDPKKSDGTAEEAATYDERSAQIAREMLFVFAEAAGKIEQPR